LRDHLGDPRSDLEQRPVVVAAPELRHHLPPEAAYPAVRQDAFEAVADLDAVAVIVHGQQDQHAAVSLFRAHAPTGGEID
jgi:hypothetical protein